MIISKIKNGYVTDIGDIIPLKNHYEKLAVEAQEIEEPSQKELVELGKQHHPYYNKQNDISNALANIAEIDAFELEKKDGVKKEVS